MHIHRDFDFVVSVFIVHRGKVLLVYHKKYGEWLPIGGHIELNENPDEALYREIREECGLKVKIIAEKPKIAHRGVQPLLTPAYMDVHRVHASHQHIAFVYFGVTRSTAVKLHEPEHAGYAWLSSGDLTKKKYRLSPSILFYCRKALKTAANIPPRKV